MALLEAGTQETRVQVPLAVGALDHPRRMHGVEMTGALLFPPRRPTPPLRPSRLRLQQGMGTKLPVGIGGST